MSALAGDVANAAKTIRKFGISNLFSAHQTLTTDSGFDRRYVGGVGSQLHHSLGPNVCPSPNSPR
jgi:hypothetical protein